MHCISWSADPKQLLEVVNALIDGRVPVCLRGRMTPGLRTRIVKLYYFRNIPYLLMMKPEGMTNSKFVHDLIFKIRGLPVLGFSCPITREADNLIATMMPQALFQIELRQHERLTPLKGSMATFFTRGGSRVSICMMDNICMGGAKLVGSFANTLSVHDIVGPCTLSLAGRDALISREVTVNRARVVRLEEVASSGDSRVIGITFDLQDYEEAQLKEHIDFISSQ